MNAVNAFRNRTLGHVGFTYMYLDATYVHVRDDALGQVVSRAVVIATGITAEGQREVLGVDIGDSEDETFWTGFLRSLRTRGLSGVRLVISDAHAGLRAAIRKTMQGTSWQRCRVHYARNLLRSSTKASQEMVAAAFRSVFAARRSRRGPGAATTKSPTPSAHASRRLQSHCVTSTMTSSVTACSSAIT